MIKKVNFLLITVFAAMLALKGVKVFKSNKETKSQVIKTTSSERQNVSQLSPHICYGYWAGYSVENPISNRNGVLLDTMRAIFPNATFRNVHGNVKEFAKILREDPQAVVVGFGEHPDLQSIKRAPTALMQCPLVVMTLRTNPWHYKGPSSLDSLRIVANEAFLDYKVIRDLRERHANDTNFLRLVSASVSKVELAEMVEKGDCDAFVMAKSKDDNGLLMDGFASMHLVRNFRSSDEIGSDGTFLYVSGLDADLAKRTIDEYETGLRRIDANGERRRIFEYYGMPYAPVNAK